MKAVTLRRHNLVSPLDLTAGELRYLIALSAELKAASRAGTERPRLTGKRIALVLDDQAAAMTSGAFTGAANDQGARVTPMAPGAGLAGHEHHLATARLLGQVFDAIEYRGFGAGLVRDLAAQAGVPVYSGLSDESLATRALAGLVTMREHSGKQLSDIAYCYVGDGRFGVVDALMIMGTRLGMDVRICAPYGTWPDAGLAEAAHQSAKDNRGRFLLTDDVDQGVCGADFLYTGMLLFLGEDRPVWGQHLRLLSPYRAGPEPAGRAGTGRIPLRQCLPGRLAMAGQQAGPGFGLDGLEVASEISGSWHSIVFDEAENRRHAIKAVLVATLAD
jgi:ornithine carbamoyltransferase